MDDQIKYLFKLFEELAEQQKKTDTFLSERFAKTEELQRITEQNMQALQKELGGIGNRDGKMLEEQFVEALQREPRVGGIQFDRAIPNVCHGSDAEFDVVLPNGKYVLAVEVKNKLEARYVRKFSNQLPFLHKITDYTDKKLLGGFAFKTATDNAVKLAEERGFFLLKQVANHIEVANKDAENFQPTAY